jgi:aminopeptidase N
MVRKLGDNVSLAKLCRFPSQHLAVSREWWTDLWLNEGFATYVASLGVAHLHPEWKSFDEESVDNTLAIFKFDALKSSHPVSVEIGHPNQISQIFDAISYSKGSVIIRMMQMFLGEESFQKGVSKYLKRHEYKNAKQDDLWAALTEVAHENQALPKKFTVKEIMDTWTLQVGYPIIRVERNYDTNSAELTQSRYLSNRDRTRDETDFCWWIPLTYTNSEEKNFNLSHVSSAKQFVDLSFIISLPFNRLKTG